MDEREKAALALQRVQRQKSSLQREMLLFSMFVFGVLFGVLSGLMASLVDSLVRGQDSYPGWYTGLLSTSLVLTICVLVLVFLKLKRERHNVAIMEENLEEMLRGR